MSKKEQNRFLNCLKGIGCLLVIFIHVELPGQMGVMLKVLGGFVVPLFFMISGFYSYHNDKTIVNKKMPGKIAHIAVITGCVIPIYIGVTLIEIIRYKGVGAILAWLKEIFSIKGIFKIVCLNNIDCIGAEALWFLLALIYAYAFLYVVNKLSLYKLSYILSVGLILCRMILTFKSDLNWHYTNNFLFTGIPYIMFGNMIARYQVKVREIITVIKSTFITGVTVIVLLLSATSIVPYFVGQVALVIFSVSIFIMAMHLPNLSWNKGIEYVGAKLSLYIYVLHCVISRCLALVITGTMQNPPAWYFYCKPFIVLVITCVIAYGIVSIKDKRNKSHFSV